jgi:membrane protease YdiL (CAAX protease family)
MTSPIPSEPRTPLSYHDPARDAFSPLVALAVVAVAMATFYALQILTAAAGLSPLVVSTVSDLALVGVAGVAMRGAGLSVRALGLRTPGLRHTLAAVLVGAVAWYPNLRLVDWLMPPTEQLRDLDQIIDRSAVAATLLVFAVLPALCEEIVFRGVMARALGRVMPTIVAAIASAVVFSTYHLSLVQAAPTFTLGLLLGVIAQRADSAAPTMLAHLLNNAIAIALTRHLLDPVANLVEGAPGASLVVALVVLAGAMVLAWPVSASSRSPRLP